MNRDRKRLATIADFIWSRAVRTRFNDRCAFCRELHTQAHHMISRRKTAARYDINNGLALCQTCHYTAHENPGWFNAQLKNTLPEYAEWLDRNKDAANELHVKDVDFYRSVIFAVGQRFTRMDLEALLSENDSKIVFEILDNHMEKP